MAKRKVLLLVGGAWYHDQPEHREVLFQILSPEFDVTMADEPSVLTLENLAGYDVIANYSSWWEPTEAQCRAMLDAVQRGKGFACLHPSSASFFNSPEYLQMIGGAFVMHDPFKRFQVQLGGESGHERWMQRKGLAQPKPRHPIIAGIEDFEVDDELFYIQGNQNEWEILARAEGHPVVYNTRWGKGRVFNIALGHDDRSLTNPNVRQLYIRGIQWAAGDL